MRNGAAIQPCRCRSGSEKPATYSWTAAEPRSTSVSRVSDGVRAIGKPHVVIDRGTLILGEDCVIRSIVARTELYVGPGATMVLGRKVHVNSGCSFSALARVEIGDRVEIAPHVTIQDNSFHDLYDRARLPESSPVVVEDDVWLAANCTLLPGVRVGRGAVVGAHAVVTRDVEPFCVVAGVPAQPVARLDPEKFVVRAER